MRHIPFSVVGLILAASLAGAHGLGQTLIQKVGEYQIDVDYDALDTLEAGWPVRFDFTIWKGEFATGEPAPFTGVWIRVDRKLGKGAINPIILSGNLGKPEFGSPGVTFTFPGAGEYELFVRFQNGSENVAEASFPLSVEEGTEPSRSRLPRDAVLGVIGGVILGVALGRFLFRAS